MNQKFLMMVGTICGAVVILSLLLLPFVTWEGGSARVVGASSGGFVLMFAWIAGGCAAMLFLKLNARIGMSDQACRIGSLVGFKMLAFFLIAHLIDGSKNGSWGVGFWLAFLASLVGAFFVYLTFNEKLAQKLAEATKGDVTEEPQAKPPSGA
jgi:hypothetical protein